MSLELKKKELELQRVELARKELEFKIEEKKEEMARLHDYVQVQLTKEQELKVEIQKIKGE